MENLKSKKALKKKLNIIELPLKPSTFLSWQKIQNCVFIINEKNNTYICLEDVSADMWLELIKNDYDTLIKSMMENYDVDETTLYSDLSAFIERLNELDVFGGK